MGTLLETFRGKLGKAEATEASKRADLFREYRTILCRQADPKDGDADRLVTLVGELGIDAADVEKHAGQIEVWERAKLLANKAADCEAELAEIKQTLEVRNREVKEIDERYRIASIGERRKDAEHRLFSANNSAREAKRIETENPELLG